MKTFVSCWQPKLDMLEVLYPQKLAKNQNCSLPILLLPWKSDCYLSHTNENSPDNTYSVSQDSGFFLFCFSYFVMQLPDLRFDCQGISFKEASSSKMAIWKNTMPATQLDKAPGPLTSHDGGSFDLDILFDFDNWLYKPLDFSFSCALNFRSYVLNSPIKSEPVKF